MHSTYNLAGLLIMGNFFRFRMQITFKKSATHITGSDLKKTMYGYENKCTYKQCLAGYFKEIELDRIRGYNSLLMLAENKFVDQYYKATIYGRDETGNFNIIHRVYRNGKLDEATINDPDFNEGEDKKIIHFIIEKGKLVLFEK